MFVKSRKNDKLETYNETDQDHLNFDPETEDLSDWNSNFHSENKNQENAEAGSIYNEDFDFFRCYFNLSTESKDEESTDEFSERYFIPITQSKSLLFPDEANQ